MATTLTIKSSAQNPVTGKTGVSDPHIRVFNDTLYLYTGHDNAPENKTWVMKYWQIFSSTDLCNWKQEGAISPADNFMGEGSKDCWAADAAKRNGKYYFYFSDQKRGVGVMQSDYPNKGFKDMLGTYLVSPDHDPTILIDNDKECTPYIVYGHKESSYKIAKLNDDMISLAQEPREIIIEGKEWENEPDWVDKNYIFKHNDTYYLSWGGEYATSKNVYGPYKCTGKVGEGYELGNLAHGSFFNWKGQFYHIWCYYIRTGYRYRESVMSYCHIDDNGLIVTDTDFLDKHFEYGVGRYSASWDKIEAEWFYEKSEGVEKIGTKESGFKVRNIKNGDFLRFSNVEFEGIFKKFTAKLEKSGKNGTLQIREGAKDGKIIGKLDIKNSTPFSTFSCNIDIEKGIKDIYLVYKSGSNSELQLDWISFSDE
ncbi:MAG: family 43 glycosylhydrolase [Rikenellaceae bacterium]